MSTPTDPPTPILSLDISRWRCGGVNPSCDHPPKDLGRGETELLNHQGYMCCLGQFTLQRGVPAEVLIAEGELGSALTSNLPHDYALCIPEFVVGDDDVDEYPDLDDTPLSNKLMSINDSGSTSVPEKIDLIREELSQHGIKLAIGNIPPELSGFLSPDPDFKPLPPVSPSDINPVSSSSS